MGGDADLLEQYANATAVFPDEVLVRPTSTATVFHRPSPRDGRVACNQAHRDDDGWRRADREAALEEFRPCLDCWRALVEAASTDPDSPVALVESDGAGATISRVEDAELGSDARPTPEPLATPTSEVACSSGCRLHAPVDRDGATLCGLQADRVVEAAVVLPTHEWCRECYDVEAFPEE